MSIFRKPGNDTWYADFALPSGGRFKKSLRTKDKRDAQQLHDKLKADSWRADNLNQPVTITFDQALLRFLTERQDRKNFASDKSRADFWLTHFSGMALKDIDEPKIYAALSGMTNRRHEENWRLRAESLRKKRQAVPKFTPKPAAHATRVTHLAFIRALLRTAERDWRMLERAPTVRLSKPKNERDRWLKPHEAQRLIDECPEPLKSVVKFALSTGLRRSNIVNLEWDQVNLQNRELYISKDQTKNGKALGVQLNDTACRVLRDQIGNHNKWVFVYKESCTKPDGTKSPVVRKMRYDANTSWRSALRRAGIEDFRFHDLRHTWASWLIQSGVPLLALKQMGGWESLDMVQRYAHLSTKHLNDHAGQIDAIFGSYVPFTSHLKQVAGDSDM